MADYRQKTFHYAFNHYRKAIKMKGLKSVNGLTLVELMISLVIGSLVMSAAYKSQRYISLSASRENDKAILQRDILTVKEFLEKDMRMTGIGIPGNGVIGSLSDTSSDILVTFVNKNQLKTKMKSKANIYDRKILIENCQGFNVDGWVCISSVDTVFREIDRIGKSFNGPDTVCFVDLLAAGPFDTTNTWVYPVDRTAYFIKNSGSGLIRSHNRTEIKISDCIDTLNLVPKNISGSQINRVSDARVLMVTIGGYVGMEDNRVLLAENTEVLIRNGI